MKTDLKLYELWYDGTIQCKTKFVEQFISMVPNGSLAVYEMTDDIRQYNTLVSKKESIQVKAACKPLSFDWKIPPKYLTLDIKEYLMSKLMEDESLDEEEMPVRISRTLSELRIYEKSGLMEMLRCLVYVIETFRENGTVWGVGRGSSVSSYVLYLIGVHDIDCVLYDLPFSDFMKA